MVTWPMTSVCLKVLWGSTVGFPSDNLASCLVSDLWMLLCRTHGRQKGGTSGSRQQRAADDGLTAKQRRKVVSKAIISSSSESSDEDR